MKTMQATHAAMAWLLGTSYQVWTRDKLYTRSLEIVWRRYVLNHMNMIQGRSLPFIYLFFRSFILQI